MSVSSEPCGSCASYERGHRVHPIQAKAAAGAVDWCPGVVTAVAGPALTVAYDAGGEVDLWHHRDLELAAGRGVRVSERWSILAVDGTWHSVRVERPSDKAPLPTSGPRPFVIVDLATGTAHEVDRA